MGFVLSSLGEHSKPNPDARGIWDTTLTPLLDNNFLSQTDDEEADYTVDEHHALYRHTERLFDALLAQAPVLCDLFQPTSL